MSFAERLLKLGDPRRAREGRARSRANKKRPIDIGTFFENEVWLLLDKMGFDELNEGSFRLDVTPEGYGSQSKQIDILARWQKEILVIECKASETENVGLDRKVLSEIHEQRPRIARVLRKEYGDCPVSFVVWTKNVAPGDRDLDDADRFGISLLDYDDWSEYLQAAKLVGEAAKFQLFADIYGPKKQAIRWSRRTPAITGQLGRYTFYYFIADPQKLLPLANVPRLRPHGERSPSESERAKILYQRMLIPRKLREIQRYLASGNRFFPNNLVVSFTKKPKVKPLKNFEPLNLKSVLLSLPAEYGSITIIDGQHRLFGYSNLAGTPQLIPVLAFEKLDPNEQGRLFVDINSKQKKVDSNILWDLHEYFGGSYQSAISQVVKGLNRRDDSSLKGKIIVPSETRKIGLPLKMTALCTAIESTNILPILNGGQETFDDDVIQNSVDLLVWYFRTVRNFDQRTMGDWDLGREGYLCTNNGVSAMLFLFDALLRNASVEPFLEGGKAVLNVTSISKVRNKVEGNLRVALGDVAALTDDERSTMRRSSSKGQQVAFAAELEARIKTANPDFHVVHLKKETGLPVTRFEALLQDLVALVLRDELGDNWYKQGIPEEFRTKISETISKRGLEPVKVTDRQKLSYTDLGTLGQVIIRRFVRFQPILRTGREVFQEQLGWMNAYRGGQASVHTGETQKFVAIMGRGAMGHYTGLIEGYLVNRIAGEIPGSS